MQEKCLKDNIVQKMKKFLITLILILIPVKSFGLIEVDITRGNLNPLPIAVSPLSIDEESRKNFQNILKKKNIGSEISLIVENNLKFEYSLSHKRNKEILISKEILEKEELIFKNNIARYLISVEFFNFMIENNIINNYAYYYDDKTDTNYKIKNFDKLSFNSKEVEKNNKEDLNPYILLPLKV